MIKHVVAVDDSHDDLLFLKDAWQTAKCASRLETFRSGPAAIEYLSQGGPASLMIVDFKMAGMSGPELIAALRERHDDLRPAVILSTSDQPSDIEASYRAGANGYVVKPFDLEKLTAIVRRLEDYWLKVNRPHERLKA